MKMEMELMPRERMARIALEMWMLKFANTEFQDEAAKILRSANRIAPQIRRSRQEFKDFLDFCTGNWFCRMKCFIGDDTQMDAIAETALRFLEHRFFIDEEIANGPDLRRRTLEAAELLGRSEEQCLWFMRTLLWKKLLVHLS